MLLRNWMSQNVITVDANDSVVDATKKLKENDIRMLPVISKGKLVGIVTDRDLKKASASDATTLEVHELLYLISKIKVKEIMTRNPITVPPDFTVEEAAEVLMKNKISGVPVVNGRNQISGIISQDDLFRAMISLTGLNSRGVQFAFQIEDRPGSIKEVADILRKYGGRMASILSSYDRVQKGYRKAYIRMYEIDRLRIPQLKEELKENATLLYMVDLRENIREVYAL